MQDLLGGSAGVSGRSLSWLPDRLVLAAGASGLEFRRGRLAGCASFGFAVGICGPRLAPLGGLFGHGRWGRAAGNLHRPERCRRPDTTATNFRSVTICSAENTWLLTALRHLKALRNSSVQLFALNRVCFGDREPDGLFCVVWGLGGGGGFTVFVPRILILLTFRRLMSTIVDVPHR